MVNRNKASIHLRFKILSLYILGVNAATNVILSKLGLMNFDAVVDRLCKILKSNPRESNVFLHIKENIIIKLKFIKKI